MSAPPSRLAGLREAAKEAMPIGTRRRDTITAALRLGRVGRAVGRDVAALAHHGDQLMDAAGELLRAAGVPVPALPYPLWLAGHRLRNGAGRRQLGAAKGAEAVPVSVVVVGSSGKSASTRPSHASLRQQAWPATDLAVAAGGWTEASRRAVEGPDRGFVVFVRPGDVLEPDLAARIAEVAGRDPLVDLVYWDDDLLGRGGMPISPRFRPGWSPETLLGANYLGRSFAIRRRALRAAGGLTPIQEGAPEGGEAGIPGSAPSAAPDGVGVGGPGSAPSGAAPDGGEECLWDLLLRSRFGVEQVARLPLVLAHVADRADEVTEAGMAAVRRHLDAAGLPATVEGWQGMARVRWYPDQWPVVSIVIPTRHNRSLLERCFATLRTTDYPEVEVVVIDNGGRTEEREAWYRAQGRSLDLRVEWWEEEPFNYSAVNNAGAKMAKGQVLVFLNDDTEAIDPGWLREMVSWALRPEIGVVGMQLLDESGAIQHGGVVLGMHGLAEHLFQGMAAGSPSLIGPTTWYRNTLSATGACVAIERSLLDDVGGFDERFQLCGSDVALGLDTVLSGRRNVCLPFGMVRHLEGATRRNFVPTADLFISYWRYQSWILGGDPYFSPNLSLFSSEPKLRPAGEVSPRQRLGVVIGRNLEAYRQRDDEAETRRMATICRAPAAAVVANHALRRARLDVGTVNWFLPDIDSPFYGGVNTALRIADHLARHHGVDNRFVLWSDPNEAYIRAALAAAFPRLAGSTIVFHDQPTAGSLAAAPSCDVAVATQWVTAYSVTNFERAARKAYLIQDLEPLFYPAGTLFALAEATYRMGLLGICNTTALEAVYRERYGGRGKAFSPSVDRTVFHPRGRRSHGRGEPVTVFLYSRPGHWRNCWELASVALAEVKARFGDRVRIVTAGSWARPEDLGSGVTHLGLLDYRATGNLYRTCDIGIALTVSEHPSYLPLELMASGVAVISFDKQAFSWLLRDGENCLRVAPNVDGLVEAIELLVDDPELRGQLTKQALTDIDRDFSDWDASLARIYDYLCDPEGGARGGR
ncbi:MAG: glycosyltransferase [Acidimicrobiales bacterium]